jgi:hypothetical protein
LPGRSFFVFQGFCFVMKQRFLQGVLAKKGVLLWCFCGEVVVDCVVNRGALMVGFWRLKKCHFFKNILFIFFTRIFCEANG